MASFLYMKSKNTEQKPLRIKHDYYRGHEVIYLDGRLDADTYRSLQVVLERCLRRKKARIIVDFSFLEFISSIGIGILLKYALPARQNGGSLILTGLSAEQRYIFEKLGLSQTIHLGSSIRAEVRAS